MLKPSPAYAHLAAACDGEGMRPRFEAELSKIWQRPVRAENFCIARVFPKGGGRFLIQYRFSESGPEGLRSRVIFGQLLAADEMVPDFVRPGKAFYLPELRLAVPVFPFDPKLLELPRFFEAGQLVSILEELRPLLNLNGTAAVAAVEVLGYRLFRRGLLRLSIREKNRTLAVVAKLVRPNKAEAFFARLLELEKAGFGPQAEDGIGVAHPLAQSPAGVLWLEEIPHPALHNLAGKPNFLCACRQAARAAAKLHSTPLSGLSPYSPADELAHLEELTTEVARIYPVLKERMEKILTRLKENRPDLKNEEAVPVHRDFYDKQVLVGEKRMTLVDVDTLARGDPALDVGNFLAHTYLRRRQHPEHQKNWRLAQSAFVEEYRRVQRTARNVETFWQGVDWWEASTLLRLAALYSLRPRWRELAAPLLERAWTTVKSKGEQND